MRTAESVVLTDWPPGPLERKTSTRMSFSGISIVSVSSMSGMTSTAAKLVWRRPWLSKGLIRTRRCVPASTRQGAERVGRVDLEGRRLEPGLLGVATCPAPSTGYWCRSAQRRYMRMSISAKSAASTPPAPARIVTTAGALVVLAVEQGLHLELADVLLQRGELALGLGQRSRRRPPPRCPSRRGPRGRRGAASMPVTRSSSALARDSAAGDLLRLLRVVPEVRVGGLLLEVGDRRSRASGSVTSRTESIVARRSLISYEKSTATRVQPKSPHEVLRFAPIPRGHPACSSPILWATPAGLVRSAAVSGRPGRSRKIGPLLGGVNFRAG